MIDVNALMGQISATMGRGLAFGYEYRDAEVQLDSLERAVSDAISQDRQEADTFWTEALRVWKHGFNYFAERSRFEAQAQAVVTEAQEAVRRVRQTCEAEVGKARDVPSKLDADAKHWARQATVVTGMVQRAGQLRAVAGWQGAARDGYVAAAEVQIDAMTELAGVMVSTGRGCMTGATLNRAIFYVVGQTIQEGINQIRSAGGGGNGRYYVRTSQAASVCRAVHSGILQAVGGSVAAGSAQALAGEISNTVTMPNLLEPGSWPTGTSAVGIRPADTRAGVRSDGRDANLNAGSVGGGSSSSVDL